MKKFTHIDEYGLSQLECEWLIQIGLRETQWFLDAEWMLSIYGEITYSKWIR